jgi:hypothetical protein
MSGDLRSQTKYVIGFSIFSLLLFAVPTIHNLLLLHIYRNYYPETAIPRSLRIWNIVFNILCSFYFLVFVVTIASYPTRHFREEQKTEALMTFSLTAILCITTLTQIIGSFQLMRIVKENARLQLEESFV